MTLYIVTRNFDLNDRRFVNTYLNHRWFSRIDKSAIDKINASQFAVSQSESKRPLESGTN